jgi:two-component system, OmpR family, phosphate regulon sensor histidine kinase PhoR
MAEQLATEDAIRRFAAALEVRVTERTAELEEHRALLDAIIETVPVGLALVDPGGTVVRINSRALDIMRATSIEADEFRNWRDLQAFDLEGERVTTLPINRTLENGEVVLGERMEIALAEQQRVIVEISTAPVVAATGEILGAVAVFQDVTLRERQERAEREFVTNAAHELQSPLAAIISAIEVLQAGAKDGEQREVFLDHIERASHRLERLVRALLILARVQSGLETPKRGIVSLCPLLTDVGHGLRLADGVKLEITCPKNLAVLSSEVLVEQAVANIAENAAKYTRTGQVVISARRVDDAVEICVGDTGPGIVAAERPKVFSRFYRPEEGASTGFGLGLAIVRAAVDALGGQIELDSAPDVGTLIRLRLPGAASLTNP